jgi:hypothetical protein
MTIFAAKNDREAVQIAVARARTMGFVLFQSGFTKDGNRMKYRTRKISQTDMNIGIANDEKTRGVTPQNWNHVVPVLCRFVSAH